jgi:hypothetical protein
MRSCNYFVSKLHLSSAFFLKKKAPFMKIARNRELEESL